jgi:predicted lysophospholipase L1 biosynthesis ABC-type transport system permease subunit
MVRGRVFRRDESAAAVAVVSERTARWFWPGQDPLGRSFTLDLDFRGKLETFEVIGVARDVRTASLSRADASYVYLPLDGAGGKHVMVRSAMPPREGAAAIRQTVGRVDATLLADLQVTSLEDGPLRLTKAMIDVAAEFAAALAAVALALAIAGIYGVVAFLTSERRHEIGVRIALGARRADVLRLVIIDGLSPVAAGALAGIGLALALGAVLQSALAFPGTPDVLFGVSAFDSVTFGGAALLLAFVTLAAGAGPFWRATRVDPVIALRQT